MTKNDKGLFEEIIDGETYEFEKWGAEEAFDVLLDISQMVGKPIGMAVAAIVGGGSEEGLLEKKIDPNIMGTVFESLTMNLAKDKAKPLIRKLSAEKVFCNGKKITFNVHYQDRIMHCFKVVKASLEVQYGNFFDEVLELTKLRGAIK